MIVEIQDIGVDLLPQYARVSSAFEVTAVLNAVRVDGGLGGIWGMLPGVCLPWRSVVYCGRW